MRALSPKVLRELRRYLESIPEPQNWDAGRFIAAIGAALAPKRSARPARQRREAKKRSKAEETREIREVVVKRAGVECEACGLAGSVELDHFFGGSGRRQALQSEATCWNLCHSCHRAKTDNVPSAMHWLRAFQQHAIRNGYHAAREMAERRIDSLALQGRASP